MKYIAYLIYYLIYPFSFLVPRNKKRVAFGSFRGAFNDNPFDENVCGKRVNEWKELRDCICRLDNKLDEAERKRILYKFWGNTMTQGKDVCKNILDRVCGA